MTRISLFLLTAVLFAQGRPAIPSRASSNTLPAPLREVGIDQHLDTQLPLDLVFKDEAGRSVRLGDYFGTRPVILAPVYYECSMLCSQVLSGLASALKAVTFDPGKDFEVVAFSFDPSEGPSQAAGKKDSSTKRYKRAGTEKGWHFLTGDEASIKAITSALGFRYKYDESTRQFAHASAVITVTPQGRVARYFYGVDYAPRDLRFGLIEASQNRIGTVVDQAMLFCFHYDPTTGKYTTAAIALLRIAGVTTLLALAGFFLMNRRPGTRPV
ncbi:MAG: SCO family protein [Bryobacterales bacterium]|nr:SCO family protein [Bryobacterales bacterium]